MSLLERYRGLGRSQRPGAVLHGCTPDIIASIQSSGALVLLVSGTFYSGKRRAIDMLVSSGRFVELLALKTRRPRSRERAGREPYRPIPFGDMFSEPGLVVCNIPMLAENRAWIRCGKQLGIRIPNLEELGEVMSEFFSVYPFREIEQVFRAASKCEKIVVIETTPNQEEAWEELCPNLKILRLKVCPREILRRAKERKGFRGRHNSLVKRIKVLEALSMPEVSSVKVPIRRVRNNNLLDLMIAVDTAHSMFVKRPRTWFWPPWRLWREWNFRRTIAATQVQEVSFAGAAT